jgi:hypothetical protein
VTLDDISRTTPPGLHPRLTVVLLSGASDDGSTLAAQLAGDDGPIDGAALGAAAERIAAADRDLRVRDHNETLARLGRERDAAADARAAAAATVAQLVARQTRMLDGARWCDAEGAAIASMAAGLNDAEETLATARERSATATARLDRVTEQRAAAKAVLEDARAELAELESAHLAEPALRRELEQAVRAHREATAATEAATTRREELEAGRAEAAAALARVDADLATLPDVDPETVESLRHALAAARAALDGPPDPAALALAAALEEVEAERSRLTKSGIEVPPVGSLEGASERLAAAEAALAAARAEASAGRGPSDWWQHLGALHNDVVDAEAKVSGRSRSTRQRYEAALAAERALLDELGFDSYVDALVSGGRLPNERAESASGIATAEADLVVARAALDDARDRERRAAPLLAVLAEQERLLRKASALVGSEPTADLVPLLLDHRSIPGATRDDLERALAAVGESPAAMSTSMESAERFLARYVASADPDRAAALAQSRAELAAQQSRLTTEAAAAAADVERLADAEDEARRTVSRLETELQTRVHGDTDPARRAASAAALRDRIATLETQLARAREEAESTVAESAAVVETALEHRDRARQNLLTLARHAARLGEEIAPQRRPAFDPLANVGALGGALRAEADILAGDVDAAHGQVELAADGLDAAVAALEGEQSLPPAGEPTDDDAVLALADLLTAGATATPAVVLEPLAAEDPVLAARLHDTVLRASTERPVVLLTTDRMTIAWAIELPVEDGAVVPVRALVADDRSLTPAES